MSTAVHAAEEQTCKVMVSRGYAAPLKRDLMPSLAMRDLKVCPKPPNVPCCSRIRMVSKGCPAGSGQSIMSTALMLVADQNLALVVKRTGENTGTSAYSACQKVFGSWLQRGCCGSRCIRIKHVR